MTARSKTAILFICLAWSCAASIRDSTRAKKRLLAAGVPVAFYTPETRWGFGASAFALFNFRSDSINAPRSSVSLGFAYTQNKQSIFSLPFNLYIHNRTWMVYGEMAFNRFLYNFYGTGNSVPKDYVERYGVQFPRLRLTCLKKVAPHFYAGPRLVYDSFSLYDLLQGGLLQTGRVPGSQGGTVAGPAAVLMFDSRDYVYYPTRGAWAELVVFRSVRIDPSAFEYTRIALDASRYFGFRDHVLALNAYAIWSPEQLPFFQMGMLGGPKKMRGFYEGRYRDNELLLFQAEYRYKILPWLGVTVFGAAGEVAKRVDLFTATNVRYTYGAGIRLRLDKAQRLNLRIDAAVGDGTVREYFTIGEAF